MGVVRLDCPLCGAVCADGPEPDAGTCPGCGASYVGGAERPVDAAAAALTAFVTAAGDADRLVSALFADDHDGVAVTSDRRDGFYFWWVFVADTDRAREAVAELARTA